MHQKRPFNHGLLGAVGNFEPLKDDRHLRCGNFADRRQYSFVRQWFTVAPSVQAFAEATWADPRWPLLRATPTLECAPERGPRSWG